MKLISDPASARRESKRAASDFPCSSCPHSVRHFSFSEESCFTFSLISFSIFLLSSSLEAMWNCSSWQSFSLLAMAPLFMDMAVSSSEILASRPAFSYSTWLRLSVRLLSSRMRLLRQLWVLWVRSRRSSACWRRRAFSLRPFSTSSLTCPACSRVRSCSIARTSARPCCSCSRTRASPASSSRRPASSLSCCHPNFASRSAPVRTLSSSPSCSACARSSCTPRTDSSSRSWLLHVLVSWSRSCPSQRALALLSSSLARSQRSWVVARASRSVLRVAMMAFLWSRVDWQSSTEGLSAALLPFLKRLIFEYSKIITCFQSYRSKDPNLIWALKLNQRKMMGYGGFVIKAKRRSRLMEICMGRLCVFVYRE